MNLDTSNVPCGFVLMALRCRWTLSKSVTNGNTMKLYGAIHFYHTKYKMVQSKNKFWRYRIGAVLITQDKVQA